MSNVVDLKRYAESKQDAEKSIDQLLAEMAGKVSACVDALTSDILQLDVAAGGGRAGAALEKLAALTELLAVHYVGDMKRQREKHAESFVCIQRSQWEKAEREHQAQAGEPAATATALDPDVFDGHGRCRMCGLGANEPEQDEMARCGHCQRGN